MAHAKATNFLDRAYFAAIPWCARHFNGDRIVTQTPPCRISKPTGEDALFAHTLNSEITIGRMLQVYEEPRSPKDRVDQIKVFIKLGNGLDGFPNVCHGGLVTTMLDEVIGALLPLNQDRKSIPSGTYMTAYLNTSFLRPVPTPTTILVRSWFTGVEGRKYFTKGTIESEGGIILARADALFIRLKSPL
ncbi:putative thioesterase superfamily protein [Rosellinia necatrix]|uniref:Putative thioesterase superfamily protein n=1 Tax=Rosellinia necatrix TaxID=77044 RepID=A0A1W2TR49_ROSNE|nr:putative thioesterase superfamily protein [Rosellinia necatrix]